MILNKDIEMCWDNDLLKCVIYVLRVKLSCDHNNEIIAVTKIII